MNYRSRETVSKRSHSEKCCTDGYPNRLRWSQFSIRYGTVRDRERNGIEARRPCLFGLRDDDRAMPLPGSTSWVHRAGDHLFVRLPFDASVHHRVCKYAYHARRRRWINCAFARVTPLARKSAALSDGWERSSNVHNYAEWPKPLAIFAVPHDACREWSADQRNCNRDALVCISISSCDRARLAPVKTAAKRRTLVLMPSQLSCSVAWHCPRWRTLHHRNSWLRPRRVAMVFPLEKKINPKTIDFGTFVSLNYEKQNKFDRKIRKYS